MVWSSSDPSPLFCRRDESDLHYSLSQVAEDCISPKFKASTTTPSCPIENHLRILKIYTLFSVQYFSNSIYFPHSGWCRSYAAPTACEQRALRVIVEGDRASGHLAHPVLTLPELQGASLLHGLLRSGVLRLYQGGSQENTICPDTQCRFLNPPLIPVVTLLLGWYQVPSAKARPSRRSVGIC
jgi:hypothetical protein